MISTTLIRRSAALLLGVSALVVLPVASSASAAPPPASSLGAGGEYFPLSPTRIYDTTTAVPGGRIDANGEVDVPVVGVGGVPAQNVLAVAVNVTVAGAPGTGFASVSPSDYDLGTAAPTSLINFQYAGHTVPNFGIIGVGTQGKITVDLDSQAAGTSRVIVDVVGFVATSSFVGDGAVSVDDGARMETVTPQRILDTREAADITGGKTVGPKESIKVPVRGKGGVPDSADVSAVVVNLTGINNRGGSTETYLTASPDQVDSAAAEAPSSSGNYPKGVQKANLAIVPLNADGSIYIYNRGGEIHVALDVVAYLQKGGDDASRTGRIVPLEAPFRSFDTREAEFGNAKLGFSSWEDWSFKDFANSVRLDGVEIGAQAGLFGNLTAVGLERLYPSEPVTSFMTMNPAYQDKQYPTAPGNSNLNFDERGAVANTAIVTYGSKNSDDYMTSAYNSNGRTHYILDVYAVILK